MKMSTLLEQKDTITTIKTLVKKAGFTVKNVQVVDSHDQYTEYVVDVAENVKDMNDRKFTQISQSKRFRSLVKQTFGEDRLRRKAVIGMIAFGPGGTKTGRFIFQLKD